MSLGPSIPLNILGESLLKYPRAPGFRIRRRYFGIHTTDIPYDRRHAHITSFHASILHLISPPFHSPTGKSPWNSALRVIRGHLKVMLSNLQHWAYEVEYQLVELLRWLSALPISRSHSSFRYFLTLYLSCCVATYKLRIPW